MERRGFHFRCLTGAAVGLCVGVLVAAGAWLGVFRSVDAATLDWFFRLRGPRPAPRHIVIVGTDEGSAGEPGSSVSSVSQCLELLRHLRESHTTPLVIAFAEPVAPASDGSPSSGELDALAEEIAEADNVVLGLPDQRTGRSGRPRRAPPEGLREAARAVGHTTLDAGDDGVVRRVPLLRERPTGRRLAFGLQVVATLLDVSEDEPVVVTETEVGYGALRMPSSAGGRMLINYSGPARSLHIIPLGKLLKDPSLAQNCSNKIVLVGPLGDTVRTPYAKGDDGLMSRVELQANVVATILNAAFLAEAGALVHMASIVVLGVLFGIALPNLRTGDKAVLALGLLALASGLSLVLFAYGGFFLRVVPLLIVLALSYVALSLHELWRANALINTEMRTLLTDRDGDEKGGYECVDAPLLAAMSSLSRSLPVSAFSLCVPMFREKGNIIAYRPGEAPRARGTYLSRSDTGMWEALHTGQAVLMESGCDSATEALELGDDCRRAVYIPLSDNGDVGAVLGLYQGDGDGLNSDQLLMAAEAMEQALAAQTRNELYENVRQGPSSGPFSDENLERRLAALSAIRTLTAEERAAAQAVLGSVSDGVVMFDLAGRPLTWNPKALEMIGATDEQMAGSSFVPFLSETALVPEQHAADVLVELFARAEPWSAEVDLPRTGRSSLVTANRVPAELEKRPIGIVVTIVDVTEFKAAARMKDELMSIATHELRTPLTSILGYAELIDDGPVDTETLEKGAEVIRRQATYLSSLIDAFLDISRLESGREELNLERVDMPRLVDRCLQALRPMAEAKRITMRAHTLGDCPPALADRRKIERVMHNLIGNAIKYSPDRAEVDVFIQALNGQVKVSVADTGRGIPDEALPRIFEKFYRVRDPSIGEVRGTGLGLPLVRLIVGSHGGEVEVESQFREGSTFSFTLPVAGNKRQYPPTPSKMVDQLVRP
ncbi:MAG: CHASE2 domain-containing protein [Armatimonadota bacterium]